MVSTPVSLGLRGGSTPWQQCMVEQNRSPHGQEAKESEEGLP
jgi:hypothetical protein